MSWLRRLLGGRDGTPRFEIPNPEWSPGSRPLHESKPELLRLLRERGARSAVIEYDGGRDEGGVTEIWISSEPLGIDPREWSDDALRGAEEVEVNWDEEGSGGLLDAAMDVVCDKWGGFAGPFFVRGRLVVDVDNEKIARHDDLWGGDEDEDFDEIYDEDLQPKVPPHEREVEEV